MGGGGEALFHVEGEGDWAVHLCGGELVGLLAEKLDGGICHTLIISTSCFSSDGSAGGTLVVFPSVARVGAVPTFAVVLGTGIVELKLNLTSGLSGAPTVGCKAPRNTREQLRNCAVEIRGFISI